MYKFGSIQKKILLSIAGGVALGLSGSPKQYFKTLKSIEREWKEINRFNFERSLKRLSAEKLLEEKKLPNGTIKLMLTEKGKKEAKRLSLLGSSIKFKKPAKWDKKWRVVAFDIPEKSKMFRNILREHLYELDFLKLQNSVFVSPYPFEKQILELVEIYSASPYVRVITAQVIDNEAYIKKHFFKK